MRRFRNQLHGCVPRSGRKHGLCRIGCGDNGWSICAGAEAWSRVGKEYYSIRLTILDTGAWYRISTRARGGMRRAGSTRILNGTRKLNLR